MRVTALNNGNIATFLLDILKDKITPTIYADEVPRTLPTGNAPFLVFSLLSPTIDYDTNAQKRIIVEIYSKELAGGITNNQECAELEQKLLDFIYEQHEKKHNFDDAPYKIFRDIMMTERFKSDKHPYFVIRASFLLRIK